MQEIKDLLPQMEELSRELLLAVREEKDEQSALDIISQYTYVVMREMTILWKETFAQLVFDDLRSLGFEFVDEVKLAPSGEKDLN